MRKTQRIVEGRFLPEEYERNFMEHVKGILGVPGGEGRRRVYLLKIQEDSNLEFT